MVTPALSFRHAVRSVLIGLLPLCCVRLGAEIFTLTDQQDRTITADVISVEDGQARIKRDDGRYFDLKLSTLAEADRKKLTDWAAREAAKPIPADALGVMMSRAKFDSKKAETVEHYTVSYTNGTTRDETRTLITTTEQWGYSVTVSNRTSKAIKGLRAECLLFTGTPAKPGRGAKSTLAISTIPARDRIIVKTGTVPLTKLSYKGELGKTSVDKLYGVWLRIYQGDTLVHESSSPDNLCQTATW